MSILAGDPLTQLAFSVYENKGVFAVLLGSGLSRAAGIQTGWEITLDLIRRVAEAQGVEDQPDWAAWYRQKTGQEPNYSTLLGELASSPAERRSILHGYIEPTEEDRETGRKVPTNAHYAIADLVRDGYIRVIVTTNFDRLMENALRERGIEPTIVASEDALAGAEPITHSRCYILKLHGDYKDARILNTAAELSEYSALYNGLLDRILDEHGLIVCGWSGEWDGALRAAVLRAPNRRYAVFWASRGQLGEGAEALVQHRRGRVIPIDDADGFFSALQQRVETLERTHRRNPAGIELLVGSAKRFLVRSEYRIQLDELFAEETDRVLDHLEAPDLSPQGLCEQGVFRARVRRYESIAEPLASMAGVLGRWGDDRELPLVLDIIRPLRARAQQVGDGVTTYLNLRSYPAVLVFTAYGLGLTRAGRWATLHRLFDAAIERRHRKPVRAVEALFHSSWKGDSDDIWKHMEGLERRHTPLSDHLLTVFTEWAKRFTGLTPDFELLFERYEMLGALAYFEQEDKNQVQQALQASRQPVAWVPGGRAVWDGHNAEKLVFELQAAPVVAALTQAGFAKGDPEFIAVFIENFKRTAKNARW